MGRSALHADRYVILMRCNTPSVEEESRGDLFHPAVVDGLVVFSCSSSAKVTCGDKILIVIGGTSRMTLGM